MSDRDAEHLEDDHGEDDTQDDVCDGRHDATVPARPSRRAALRRAEREAAAHLKRGQSMVHRGFNRQARRHDPDVIEIMRRGRH